jgi:hypothetical protein
MGPVGWYHYHFPALDCSPAVPSYFVPHILLKRVHQNSNPDQFNKNTRSHPTNNKTRDLVLRLHSMHLFISFPSHILIHPPPLLSLIPSSSKNTLLVPCQHHSPLPPLILLCDTSLYMVCTTPSFPPHHLTTFQSPTPPLLSTYSHPKYTFLSITPLPSSFPVPIPIASFSHFFPIRHSYTTILRPSSISPYSKHHTTRINYSIFRNQPHQIHPFYTMSCINIVFIYSTSTCSQCSTH